MTGGVDEMPSHASVGRGMAVVVANIVTDVTDWLDEFSSNWWFLLIIFSVALLDSVFPVVPGETSVIAGGVAAGSGNQVLALVIFAGAFGAFLGDNLAYTIGDRFEPRVRAWACLLYTSDAADDN